jgi:hypothetical protein
MDTKNSFSSCRPKASIEGMETVHQYEHDHQNDAENLTEVEKQMRDEEISFYSNSENEHEDEDDIWGLLTGVAGDIYEWLVNCDRERKLLSSYPMRGLRV